MGSFTFGDLRFTSVSQQLDERVGFGRQLGSRNQIAGHLPICNRKSGLGECIGDLHSSRRIRALDFLAKNQGHIASGVLQQLLARNTGPGAKLQTLHQVNERTASYPG